jgi:integrase/recombinase XerC
MIKDLEPAQPPEMEIIEAYLTHIRRRGDTEATVDGRAEILYRLNRQLPYGIGQASTEDLNSWLDRDYLSVNAKATYYRAIRSFYTWAADPDDPWLDQDPSIRLERRKDARGSARPVSDEQLATILRDAPEPVRTWSLIAAYQGLRAIEISRLDREHMTEQNLYVVKGKGNKPRVHDMDPDVWAAVRDLPRGPIALGPDGERLTPFEVSRIAAHCYRRQLKMPGVALHRLRHWLGVTVQREYKDARVTMAVLGHSSLTSTQIYTDATDEQQRQARTTLPRFSV